MVNVEPQLEDVGKIREELEAKLDNIARRIEYVSGAGLIVEVPKDLVRDAVKIVHDELDAYLRVVVGVDERPVKGVFSSYYVFGLDNIGLNIIITTYMNPGNPSIPTITDIAPSADWYELEMYDLLGIRVENRLLYRFVLPEDWPEGLYPLRKDVAHDIRPSQTPIEKGIITGPRIPVGPYHPALHEPEYFELYVEGERVVDVKYNGFHVHRGIEKLGESRFTYQQIPFLAERICGICGFVHSVCYTQAVENAAKIEVPERAEFIRSIILEVERLHSHLLWVGVACHLLGYDAGFMHAWRIREKIMVLAELLTGSRKTYGINLIGGVRKDINRDKIDTVLKTIKWVEDEFRKLVEVITSVPQVVKRVSGTGILPKHEARRYSVVGPVARASGLNRDVRKDYPYAAYKHVSFKVPVYTEGDNLARLLVRVDEVFESINIIRQLLDQLPSGPIMAENIEIPEGSIGISSVEAPRGEDIHFVITGKGKPYRWRVRAPTYQNIPALKVMLRDVPLADAPLTIASIDPCFSCTDRVIVIDVSTRKRKIISLRKLVELESSRCMI